MRTRTSSAMLGYLVENFSFTIRETGLPGLAPLSTVASVLTHDQVAGPLLHLEIVHRVLDWRPASLHEQEWETTKGTIVTPYEPDVSLRSSTALTEERRRPFASWLASKRNLIFAHSTKRAYAHGGAELRDQVTAKFRSTPQRPGICALDSGAVLAEGLATEGVRHVDHLQNSIGRGLPSEEWAAQIRASVFCLVMRGDTPTSLSLYNAVAAGCIPLIVSDALELVGLPAGLGGLEQILFSAPPQRNGGSSSTNTSEAVLSLRSFAVQISEDAFFRSGPGKIERDLCERFILPWAARSRNDSGSLAGENSAYGLNASRPPVGAVPARAEEQELFLLRRNLIDFAQIHLLYHHPQTKVADDFLHRVDREFGDLVPLMDVASRVVAASLPGATNSHTGRTESGEALSTTTFSPSAESGMPASTTQRESSGRFVVFTNTAALAGQGKRHNIGSWFTDCGQVAREGGYECGFDLFVSVYGESSADLQPEYELRKGGGNERIVAHVQKGSAAQTWWRSGVGSSAAPEENSTSAGPPNVGTAEFRIRVHNGDVIASSSKQAAAELGPGNSVGREAPKIRLLARLCVGFAERVPAEEQKSPTALTAAFAEKVTSKFQRLYLFYQHLHSAMSVAEPRRSGISAVFVLDDDLVISGLWIRQSFLLREKFDLRVAQPCRTDDRISHELTRCRLAGAGKRDAAPRHTGDVAVEGGDGYEYGRQDRRVLGRYVSFVEVGAPIFQWTFLRRFLRDHYDPSLASTGIDGWYSWIATNKMRNKKALAVLDSVQGPAVWNPPRRSRGSSHVVALDEEKKNGIGTINNPWRWKEIRMSLGIPKWTAEEWGTLVG